MNDQEGRMPDDLQRVVYRIRSNKPQVTDLDLDRIKLRAMARAQRPSASRLGRGMLRSKIVTLGLVFGLVASGGTAGVIAGGIGDTIRSAATGEYCEHHNPHHLHLCPPPPHHHPPPPHHHPPPPHHHPPPPPHHPPPHHK
jgi:hypothetical protein